MRFILTIISFAIPILAFTSPYDDGVRRFNDGHYYDAARALLKVHDGKSEYMLYKIYKKTGNDKEAIGHLKLSGEQRYIKAMRLLDSMNIKNSKGKPYYEVMADMGIVDMEVKAASLTKDRLKKFEWLLDAARKGDVPSMAKLGDIYLTTLRPKEAKILASYRLH